MLHTLGPGDELVIHQRARARRGGTGGRAAPRQAAEVEGRGALTGGTQEPNSPRPSLMLTSLRCLNHYREVGLRHLEQKQQQSRLNPRWLRCQEGTAPGKASVPSCGAGRRGGGNKTIFTGT